MSDLTRFRDHCRRMGGPIVQANIHLDPDQRTLFRRLAAEVDAYIDHDPNVVTTEPLHDPGPGLFEETT